MTTATVTGEKRRLRTVFLGNETPLTRALCRWLANRTDLKLIVWTDLISWPHRPSIAARIGRRLLARVRRKGVLRVVNEAAYYVIYALILRPGEENRIRQLTEQFASEIRGDLGDVHQIRPVALRDTRLLERVRSLDLDAGFATCTHAYFPKELIRAPRHGVFLWHEGITPEYRGVYPAFWALYRDDLASIGYSLLRMTDRLDAGPVFAQGPVSGADFERDWYCYLSAKSVVDSLPEVGR
ncbi:MAG TPA: formyltransferase family protein, partial [Thermoanaerobaculia bacterium]|nr:formyltransferase family protein [Thermoanaerobaculia bacterium]